MTRAQILESTLGISRLSMTSLQEDLMFFTSVSTRTDIHRDAHTHTTTHNQKMKLISYKRKQDLCGPVKMHTLPRGVQLGTFHQHSVLSHQLSF